jgi:hypothetical protein
MIIDYQREHRPTFRFAFRGHHDRAPSPLRLSAAGPKTNDRFYAAALRPPADCPGGRVLRHFLHAQRTQCQENSTMQNRKVGPKTSAVAVMFAAAFVATHAAAQAPQSKGPPGGPPGDFIDAVNETPSSVKLEFFPTNAPAGPDARAQMMACMGPKQTVRWPLGPETPVGKIRMQVMGDNGCDGPQQKVVCERSIERAPGLQYVTLRGEGRNCGVFPMPAPPGGDMLKLSQACGPTGHWSPLTIRNKDEKQALWLTVYEDRHIIEGGQRILAAACWLPGETRMACVDRRNLVLRVEMTSRDKGHSRSTSCSEPVTCKGGNLLLEMAKAYDGHKITWGWPCNWSWGI